MLVFCFLETSDYCTSTASVGAWTVESSQLKTRKGFPEPSALQHSLRNQGIHSGSPLGEVKALPVPTSLLVGADGRVLWKDQSENYQRRSDPDVVLGALREHLG